MTCFLVGLAPAFVLASTALPWQDPPQHTDLPVRSVVLFSSGVGYFEHAGVVRGDASTELRFKTAQINDILKSLVLQDQDGGHVTAVTYPSQDPIAKTLRSFQVDITGNPGMAALLNQLRGARVTLQSQAERISGTILGVEVRKKAVDRGDPIDTPVLNLLSGVSIRSVELPAIASLTLDDPQLQEELGRALAALSQARDQDKKPVTISFHGSGDRHVRVGYVVETPIWKTSYRLILDDRSAHLQGWAIVENQTESDWNNVALSLVSGRPVSFVMDLYQPLYMQRPVVVPELYAGLRPQLYDAAISVRGGRSDLPMDRAPTMLQDLVVTGDQRSAMVPRDQVATKQLTATTGFEDASITVSAAGTGSPIGRINQSTRSVASGQPLGELFQYTIANVTLARQKSAMLPIVTDSVNAERVSIYNASVMPRYPLNGVRLRNITGKHLLQGPVTVLDKGAYAGDARIDNIPPGQDRLLSYGVDLEVLVDNSTNTLQTNAIMTARISKGTLITTRKMMSSQDYRFDNRGSRDKIVLVEHPIRQGWKLVDTQDPVETTPALYRFQGKAVAGKITVLSVKEEFVRDETMTLLPADIGAIVSYSRAGEIPASVRDALARAIELKKSVAEFEQQVTNHTASITAIADEQSRIRENMKTVDPKSQYYERLLAKLNDQESSIERLQKERDDLQQKRDTARRALEEYLGGLTVG